MSMFSRSAMPLAALAIFGSALHAQRSHNPGLREVGGMGPVWHFGFALGEPRGQFAEAVDNIPGMDVAFTSGGPLGIRLGTSLLVYGSDRWLFPAGGRSYDEIRINNFIASFGIGPQITLGRGATRLYAYGTLGFAYFATVSWGDGCDCEGWSNTEFDDVTPAREAGVGILLGLSRSFRIDLSARYMHNGQVSYLVEGDVDPEAGSIATPRSGEVNLMVYRVGFSIGGR